MATILRGKRKGDHVKITQWQNDWISGDTEGGPEVFLPTNLQFSIAEMEEILESSKNSFFLKIYEPTKDLRFKKRK